MTRQGEAGNRGLYLRELRLALRNNSGAYGYSVMITGTLAVLTAVNRSPQVGQVFLFLLGAVLSFAAVEVLATRVFTKPMNEDEATKVIALGSSLNFASIAVAVGAAALVALVLPSTLSWTAGGFVASLVYLLTAAVEMAVARRIEEYRNLE
ncbi:hypothetical protein GCM10023224_24870 [Streptomonospora halophila]|uniref:Uncharacterized protein n=1 Tax=Streptomonospora halophila TaxID=427369 RepID=A0ABP9GJ45_9ACTN